MCLWPLFLVAALDAAPQVGLRAAGGRVLDGCRACYGSSHTGALAAIDALGLGVRSEG